MTFHVPAVSFAGESRPIEAFGRIELRIPAEATGGILSVWESVVTPEAGPPLHVHANEDEFFYVLSGSFQFWCGDTTFLGSPGTSVVLPRGVPHTYRNIGTETGRFFGCAMPGGFENFFIEIERTGASDPETVGAIAARYGLSFVPAASAAAA